MIAARTGSFTLTCILSADMARTEKQALQDLQNKLLQAEESATEFGGLVETGFAD